MGQLFDPAALREGLLSAGARYVEFCRRPDLSAGLYRLAAGESDPQAPHTEDEIYVVLSGSAVLRVGTEDLPVTRGSVAFVPAGEEHRFHSITEELLVVVMFGPAEGTRR
ncbi:MAG: cupin domain-containing protein [Pseudonocardiales bacterium]